MQSTSNFEQSISHKLGIQSTDVESVEYEGETITRYEMYTVKFKNGITATYTQVFSTGDDIQETLIDEMLDIPREQTNELQEIDFSKLYTVEELEELYETIAMKLQGEQPNVKDIN